MNEPENSLYPARVNDPVRDAIRSSRSAFMSTAMMSCVINILTLTAPIFMMQVSDRVLSSQSVPTLLVISGLALMLYLFFGLLDYLRTRVVSRVGMGLDARLSGLTFEISALLPIKLGQKAQAQNPMGDLEVLRQFLSGPGPAAIFDLPWMPFYLVIIYLLHPMLGIMAACGAVVIALLIALNEFLARDAMSDLGNSINDRSRFLKECYQASEVVHSMGMTQRLREKWTDENGEHLLKQLRSHDTANLFSALIKTFRFIMQSAILAGGAWLAINGSATPGVMIAASIISSRALAPVEQAVGYWRGFVSARQSFHRLRSLTGSWVTEQIETRIALPKHSLKVNDLATAPIDLAEPFVTGISFELNAGEALGIIGHSGSGKTSLVRAIVNVAPVLAGSVRFDGAELTQWSPQDQGKFVGYLPQGTQLLDGTIAQNISRFEPGDQSARIIEAAQLTGIHDMIVAMPKGYDTRVGAQGHLLSGGQRQRIGLARAIFGNPFLVILDEPNSNLDSAGEASLAETIRHLKDRGSVVLVIAHRMSALSAMDKILVVEKGRCKAIGPKDQLLKPVMQKAS